MTVITTIIMMMSHRSLNMNINNLFLLPLVLNISIPSTSRIIILAPHHHDLR
jgi:hypothetical protein